MKRIKLFSAVAIFCAATFVGYNAYQQSTMTEQERLMQANIEALSNDEYTYDDFGDYVVYHDFRNRWMGLAAGCKYKIGSLCKVQKTDLPDISLEL